MSYVLDLDQLAKLNAAAVSVGMSLEDSVGATARLTDEEGNAIARLPAQLVSALSALPCEPAAEVLQWIRSELRVSHASGYKFGKGEGRREIVDTVHELLGIDRIVRTLESAGVQR